MHVDNVKKALRSAEVQHKEGIVLRRNHAYILLLQCSKQKDLESGRRLRSLMMDSKLDLIPVLADHLIRLFASCESLDEANEVFEKVAKPSAHTWCAIIAAHAKLDHCDSSFNLYERMMLSGVKGNKCVFLAVLKACSNAPALAQGRQVHNQIIDCGLESDVKLGNSLIDLYAKCGRMDEAYTVFDNLPDRDIVSWNAMFSGYIQHSHFRYAALFFELMQGAGIKPNCVSWGALIHGYAENGEGLLALDSFEKMQEDGLKPDRVIFFGVLKACADLGGITQGRLIHDHIIRFSLKLNNSVGNALIEMYSKCGSLEESRRVLDNLRPRDVVAWNTLITAYSSYGLTKLAMRALWDMQLEGVKPDNVTIISLLSCCSHAGLIGEFCTHIKAMQGEHGIVPDTKHYTCMLDLLGNIGHLREASSMQQAMELDFISSVCLLTSCRRHCDPELGRNYFPQSLNCKHKNVTDLGLSLGDTGKLNGLFSRLKGFVSDKFLLKTQSSPWLELQC